MVTQAQLQVLKEARRYGIGRLFLHARRDFLSRLAEKMEDHSDLTAHSRGRLLPYIDVDGTRSVDLARRMGVTKQAVGRMVKELEEEGLLVREADTADGRAALVRFTEAGLEYMRRMHKMIQQVERDYERMFGADTMQQVRATLKVIAYGDENGDVAPVKTRRRMGAPRAR